VLDLHNIKRLDDINFNLKLKETLNKETKEMKPLYLPHLDKFKDNIKHIRMDYSRNVKSFPFPTMLTNEKRQVVNSLLKEKIKSLENVNQIYKGSFINLFENEIEFKELLASNYMSYDELNNFIDKAGSKNGNRKYI